ncbi:hypothetical protein [Streptomyces lunaelactis]|uniref:hypothetical protein n=1 Tax=Streptomyces lunaelactis TaxID=1535768 RepID=UPI002814DD62|nr:hypothetical protein [Streptomyces lunaelactis]
MLVRTGVRFQPFAQPPALDGILTDAAALGFAMCAPGRRPARRFRGADAGRRLDTYSGPRLSLAYVDCRPGTFHRLADLIELLEPGGLCVVDDLLPQAIRHAGHQGRVGSFLAQLPDMANLRFTPLRWASGPGVGVPI